MANSIDDVMTQKCRLKRQVQQGIMHQLDHTVTTRKHFWRLSPLRDMYFYFSLCRCDCSILPEPNPTIIEGTYVMLKLFIKWNKLCAFQLALLLLAKQTLIAACD